MAATRAGSIKKYFARLPDPRVRGRTRHLLLDIVVLAICGVIANCDDCPDIALFARKRQAWFRRFLRLPNGVPSHDTFERVFACLDPAAFERCCIAWLRAVAGLLGVGHIAIDGKTLAGSAGSTLGPLHLVSAWATQAHLTLGQVAVDGKSNEITAIPRLLELLDLRGCVVTIDAAGCQKDIAAQIVAKGADYVLALKENQPALYEQVADYFLGQIAEASGGELRRHLRAEEGHGRTETRETFVAPAPRGWWPRGRGPGWRPSPW